MSDEVVVIQVVYVTSHEGGPWAVQVGTRRYGNTSTSLIYPRFHNRLNANRVGASLAEAYKNEDVSVEFTPARQKKPLKVKR